MPLDMGNQAIATQIQAPNSLANIANLAAISNALQNLKYNQATFNSGVAQAAAQAQYAQNQAALSSANLQPLIQQQAALTSQAQTKAQSDKFTLNKDYANTALETATGLLQDPRITAGTPSNPNQPYDDEAAAKALEEARQQMIAKGVPAEQALLATSPFMTMVHTPGAIHNMLANTVRGLTSAATQVAQTQVPANQQQQVTTDPVGNPIVVSRNPYGVVTNVNGAPVQGQSTTPPTIIPQGETVQSYNDLIANRAAVSKAALAVPDQHTYNQNVLQLLNNSKGWSATGPGAAELARLQGTVGIPTGTSYADTFQQISHNLAMATQANEKAMGVHTDAQAVTTGLATGTPQMDPKALANAVKMNDATASGVAAYGQANEAAIRAKGIVGQRQFQSQWASVYSPRVMMLHNALQQGDQQEVNDIIKSVGGKGSPGALDLARRAQAIQSLVTTGDLPAGGP
jgi:hypothetical protein